MTLDPDEQHDLRMTARGFFEKHSDEPAVRSTMESEEGFDRELWATMAEQLGLPALLIPEKFGGSGFGFAELQIVSEEMGRALLCAPFLSSAVLAAQSLLASGDDERCGQILPSIADGSLLAALAFTDQRGQFDSVDDCVRADEHGGRWRLNGRRMFVLDAASADVVLVAAASPQGPGLFAVDKRADGYRASALETLDMTRRQAHVDFNDVDAALIGEVGGADH
jgi:alkylation response protein AidB-like acyl-CoA dehydrogenase